jgi:UDP-N-acetyl-D-galactosamine dehydrogenase
LVTKQALTELDGLILAVPHKLFLEAVKDWFGMVREGGVIADIKAVLDPKKVPGIFKYWSL